LVFGRSNRVEQLLNFSRDHSLLIDALIFLSPQRPNWRLDLSGTLCAVMYGGPKVPDLPSNSTTKPSSLGSINATHRHEPLLIAVDKKILFKVPIRFRDDVRVEYSA
jgi:hypothetical protein